MYSNEQIIEWVRGHYSPAFAQAVEMILSEDPPASPGFLLYTQRSFSNEMREAGVLPREARPT